ncbi:winged helix DNA-binding domain-containing protein [Streptomyces iconiensis]|uniref:Winged helix DNA-binding domain-containing protein n=1 Tax=Streptomyces iconiensis TaxID=1384038 RepID=A0ABT6ZZW6_9ACTN|nr:winged helix DNA-binding domain-containing protein [Streptomyces iconiensis]MDJ1134615.1 winged helix DNA-binding domain-containing protein [Streptomyces iconiensis]
MTTQPDASLPQLAWTDVNAARLARNHLSASATGHDPASVASAMLGAHAQVMSAAEVSLATRMEPGTTRQDVREALWTEHALVKTYGPRGTVHLLPTHELPLWTGALSAIPRPTGIPAKARDGSPLLTPDRLDAVVAAVGDALADAELTVDELTDAVAERAGAWAADPVMEAFQDGWPRWRAATAHAAHAGVLCFGHNRGRKVTYTNPHRWLPGFRPLAPEVALTRLVRRYLYTYGPAHPAHFAKWLAAPTGWAAALFASLEGEGEVERVVLEAGGERSEAWRVAGEAVEARDTAAPVPAVRLLPYFDAFTVASQPRELLFPGRAYERALAGGQAGNYPVLLLDGTVGGVWHQRRSGRRLQVTVEPLRPLTPDRRTALETEVERLAHIQEARAELTVGPVTVGAHA